MDEYISREAALKNQRWNGRMDEYVVFVRDIEEIPAADVMEVKHVKTNADKIRAMTDEELALFLKRFSDCAFCPAFSTKCKSINFDNCEDAWLDWLKQEVIDR